MNAFKKTLVAIAAAATLGATGLAATQASANDYGYGYGGYGGYGYSYPSYGYGYGYPSYSYGYGYPSYGYGVWLRPPALRLRLRPPLVTAVFQASTRGWVVVAAGPETSRASRGLSVYAGQFTGEEAAAVEVAAMTSPNHEVTVTSALILDDAGSLRPLRRSADGKVHRHHNRRNRDGPPPETGPPNDSHRHSRKA